MTKKADNLARIEANRRAAYFEKVRSLLGHVAERITQASTDIAMDTGSTAEAFAALIASGEPVGHAIHPLKEIAVAEAEKACRASVVKIAAALEAAGWNLDAVAPRPHHNANYFDYKAMNNKRSHYSGVTRTVSSASSPYDKAPTIVAMDDKMIERRVMQWREGAAFQYDAFICKLVAKIGACESATLNGNHVWSHSILTVTKAGGVVENWKTQQIENCSVLGNYFPQWPTRLMKGGA